MRSRFMSLAVSCTAVFAMAVAVPLGASAHTHSSSKKHHAVHHRFASGSDSSAISFGVVGGSMRPWTVTILPNGMVTATDPKYPIASHHVPSPADTLAGLMKLAEAEGFFSMPATTLCPGTHPDVVSRFITMNTTTGTTTVKVHGQCLPAFNQLFAVLSASAGITSP